VSLDPTTSAWNNTDATGNEVQGMKGEYFSINNWSGDAAVNRTEKQVDLDWAKDKNLPFESNTSTSDTYTSKGSTAGELNG
ncbi:hypothetical protein RA272_30085, partial [Pseudomonas syringae pv. tagetis]|uniref:hypothetical protein n=1 Tax=Pseudomonas syringae group genomosp. 7 TaxID=251699 RepID=UPI00376FF2A8